MASEQLKLGLEKYWQVQLSLVEEMQFRSELKVRKETLSGELKEISEWFESIEDVKYQLQLDDDFDDTILNTIKQKKSSANQWSWWKIADSLLIDSVLIFISLAYMAWLVPQPDTDHELAEIKNTQENPEKAFKETKATLLLMANMINSGKDHLNSLQLFQVAREKVQNTLKKEETKKVSSD